MTYVPPPGYTPPPMPPGSGPPQGPPQNPYGSPYGPPPGRRGNAWGIVSLVFGLLLCVPVLASLVAVVTGAVGLIRSNRPNTGGRVTSVLGLILGLLGLLLWAGAGVGSWVAYNGSADTRAASNRFVQDLRAGKVDAVLKANPALTRTEVQAASDRVQDLKNVAGVYSIPMPSEGGPAGSRSAMTVIADDASHTHQFQLFLTTQGGTPVVVKFNVMR